MDPFAKPGVGDDLPSRKALWDAMIDAARAFRFDALGGADPRGSNRSLTVSLEVLVRNDTGEDLEAGAVVELGDALVLPEDYPDDVRRRPAFAVTTLPTGATVKFAILSVPLKGAVDEEEEPAVDEEEEPAVDEEEEPAEGELGPAVIQGVAVCEVDASSGSFASPTAGEAYLTAGTSGPVRVLQRASGSGPQPAVVLIVGPGGSGLVYLASCVGGVLVNTVVPSPTST